jgi:plastocyanin
VSRRIVSLIAALAVLIAAGVAAPAALAGDPCFHRFDNRPAPTEGRTASITMGDCVFTPTVVHVPVGTTVEWANASSQGHEVVGSNLAWGAHDKILQPGDSIGWTFERPGVYAYSCMIHPGMTGAIVVGGATAAAETPTQAEAPGSDEATAAGVQGPGQDAGAIAGIGTAAGAGALALVALWLVRRARRSPLA